jgi:uncharacterized protein YhjY with autotransporter beta-barrel domain
MRKAMARGQLPNRGSLRSSNRPIVAAAFITALAVAQFALADEADAQILGTAETYGVLAGSTVTNTGSSVIMGNVGVAPGTAVVGFPPGIVVPPGTIHSNDGSSQQAQNDLTTAYNALRGLPTQVDLTGQNLGGLNLGPAVYSFATSAQLTGLLTLNGQGNSAAQFVFNIGTTLTTASNSVVLLINGANGNNVYWTVGSSATLGTTSVFAGNILANQSITLNTGATITCGRALAQVGAVTLDSNTITLCARGGDSGDISQDELGGGGVGGGQQAAFDATRLFGSAIMAQAAFWLYGSGPDFSGITPQNNRPMKLGAVASDEERALYSGYQPRTWRLWTSGFGGSSSFQGDGAGTPELSTRTYGIGVGLDYEVDPTLLLGVAGGYTYTPFSVENFLTSGQAESGQFALYGVKRYGPGYVAGIAEYTHLYNKSDRSIDWVVDERATGHYTGDGFYGRLETGWRQIFGAHAVTPYAAIDVAPFRFGGFTEADPGILGLTFGSQSVTSVMSTLGLQFDTRMALDNGQRLTPFTRIAWGHEFNPDRGVDSTMISSPEVSFSPEGAFVARDAALVDAGLKLDVTEHTGLFAYFNGAFGDNSQSYGGNAGVKISW